MWSYRYASCRWMCTNKTKEMPCIPVKPYACMSMARSLGNVDMGKSCKGQVPNALKWGPVS
jgi:hypothetical protein